MRKVGHIGVITSLWDEDKLKSELFHLDRNYKNDIKIIESGNNLVFKKKKSEMIKKQNDIRLLENCINKKFYYITPDDVKKEFDIVVVLMSECKDGYKADLLIS